MYSVNRIVRRLLMLTIFSLTVGASWAQQAVVNDVKKTLNQLKTTTTDYSNAIKKLQPALTDEKTANRAETWYILAKANLGLYNKWEDSQRVGRQPDLSTMNHALINAYAAWEHALSLDTLWLTDGQGAPLLNKKTGKQRYKTKYSGEIRSALISNADRLYGAGNQLFNLRDGKGALDAWEYYCRYHGAADSLTASVRYYQAIALWQQQDYAAAARHFATARELGYRHVEAYDYALTCLEATGDTTAIVKLAHEAYEEFGTAQPRYLRIIINDCVKHSDFDRAHALIDAALARDSLDVEMLVAKGYVVERQHGVDAAIPCYERALEVNPDNLRALVSVGRYYYNKATASRRQDAMTRELYKRALPLLEKVYAGRPETRGVRAALKDIYYRLGMAERLDALER